MASFAVLGFFFPAFCLLVCIKGSRFFLLGFSDSKFSKISHLEVKVWLGDSQGPLGTEGEPGASAVSMLDSQTIRFSL